MKSMKLFNRFLHAGKDSGSKGARILFAIAVFFIIAGISISGCNKDREDDPDLLAFVSSKGSGALAINLSSLISKTILPAIDLDIASYDISGTGPDSETFQYTDVTNDNITIDDLKAGNWEVTVDAKNIDGVVVGRGSVYADVADGSTTEIDITVVPLEGNGILDITLTWSNDISGVISIEAELVGSVVIPLVFNIDDSSASYNGEIPAGYYDLIIILKSDGNKKGGIAETVRIIEGQTTSGVINIIAKAPDAPADLTANAVSSSQIDLSWTDNSDVETGFRIERAPDVGGNPGVYVVIATLIANESSYNNTGLEANTTYHYRVYAYNDAGDSSPAEASAITQELTSDQIIADHTVVDRYVDIPQVWIDEVKKMYLNIPGESHSSGYRRGLSLLQTLEPGYPVIVTESGDPETYREDALRINGYVRNQYNKWSEGAGEAQWYTWLAWEPENPSYPTNNAVLIKNHIYYCNTNSLEIAAIGFGWCWDMTWHNSPGGGVDTVYNVMWAGASEGGPDGDSRWGLDSGDFDLTGNRVSMDTYLSATGEYIELCNTNGYSTVVFFTTGPVDGGRNTGESGYQRWLKHEYMRNHVNADSNRVLFDYADILCWNNDNVRYEVTWTDHISVLQTFQAIHPDNMKDLDGGYVEDGDHIGEVGTIRLAKALWWVLARIAGWDGVTTD